MTKYKMLITGRNNMVTDDIFTHISDDFGAITCSCRFEDMVRHIEMFQPDIFLVCLNGESRSELSAYAELKRRLTRTEIPTVVIGTQEECDEFERTVVQMADLLLQRPVSAELIRQEVLSLMRQVEQDKKDREIMQKRLEELRRSAEKKHVLVVDDDPVMLKLIKEYLGEHYAVATAISGKIAHKFLEVKHTDLILLDYEMPVESGTQVLESIREDSRFDDVPVIFLSGVTEKEKICKALLLKPQGYLVKPIDREKLLGTVEKFIG